MQVKQCSWWSIVGIIVLFVGLCIAAAVLSGCSAPPGASNVPGKFSSDIVEVKLLDDGRTAVLLKPFSYTDGRGKVWDVPAGQETDGASIPRELWTTVGGPYEGKYRFAAVVHDRYCRHQTEPWQDVHRMFYEACISAGVDETLAKIMYAGIYHFGPRWGDVTPTQPTTRAARPRTAAASRSEMEDMELKIKAKPDISLDEIERL